MPPGTKPADDRAEPDAHPHHTSVHEENIGRLGLVLKAADRFRGMDALERAREVAASWDERVRAGLPAEPRHLRRAHASRPRHRRDGRRTTTSSSAGWTATACPARTCSASTSPTGIPASGPRTTGHSSSPRARRAGWSRSSGSTSTRARSRRPTRCLDLGARGIKLHPRAQKFLPNDERLVPVFALAAERRVPILIHAGRGLPPIAEGLEKLVDDHAGSQLILAHAGIADLANLAHRFSGKRGVFFDTSVWSAVDLLGLLRLLPPEQIVYASDYPYGQQPGSLLLSLRVAQTVGFDERRIRDMFAGNANRIADGEEPLEPSTPQGIETLAQPLAQARIHQYLSMALPLLFTRQPDGFGALGLALNATERAGTAISRGRKARQSQIRELLLAARDLWTTLPGHGRSQTSATSTRADCPPDSDSRHRGSDNP